MLTTDREKKICKKYRARDETNHVHCCECTLRKGKGSYDFRCKANSHYDRKQKDWIYDESEVRE